MLRLRYSRGLLSVEGGGPHFEERMHETQTEVADWRATLDAEIAKVSDESMPRTQRLGVVIALCENKALLSEMSEAYGSDPAAVTSMLMRLGAACHGAAKPVAEIRKLVERSAKKPRLQDRFARPTMVVRDNLYDLAMAAIPHLERAGTVYQRGQRLVYVSSDGSPYEWLKSSDPAIRAHTGSSLAVEFNRVCETVEQVTERTGEVRLVQRTCPMSLPTSVMSLASWPFRALEGITRIPILRPDGTVCDAPGYDNATGYIYDPDPNLVLSIPEKVTPEMAAAAALRLLDPFVDFPFAMVDGFTYEATPYRSAVVAAILTVVARPGIRGCTPFFVFSATTPKSGKTLLVDLVYAIATGHAATRAAQVEREEEMEKRVTAILMAGMTAVLIDNVTRLGGPSLDAVATAYPRYMGRVLGSTDMPEVPARTVWFFSGNNIEWIGDILQRLIPVHLEPDCENPENRTGFRHEQVMRYVQENRGEFLTAAYTLLRGWEQAGRPMAKLPRMGAFEAWSDVIRQAMVWAGLTDPYLGVARFKVDNDDGRSEAASLLTAWYSLYGPKEMALAFIAKNVTADNPATTEMWAALQPWVRDGKVDPLRLAGWLRKHKGRIFGGYKAEVKPGRGGVMGWRVVADVRQKKLDLPEVEEERWGAPVDDGVPY
jgi:predicted transcriptional regulator with HTH domain